MAGFHIHSCWVVTQDNQAWQDEMHAKLVMGSGSSDFADLICHLLDYNVQGRWTPAQALQEVCVQNINAACGYPSLLVPMPAAVQNSCIPMGNLSSQASHAGSFFSSALVKSLSFDGPAQLAVVDNSPRIATAPASNAFQYGTDRDFVTEGSATTQWQLASLLPPDVSPRSGGAVSGAHHSLAVGGSLHSNIAAITPAVSNLTADLPARYNVDSPHLQPYHSHSIDASPALPSTAGFWQVPDREIPAAYHVPDSFGQFPGQGFDPSAAIHSDAGHQGASNAWTVDSQNSTDEATAMLPADLFDDDLTYAEPDAAVAFLPSDLLDLDEETEAEQALLSRAHDEADDQSALLDQGNAPQAETAQLVDDSAQPLQPYGVTGLEASVDLLGVYSRVNNTFICKLAVGNVSR